MSFGQIDLLLKAVLTIRFGACELLFQLIKTVLVGLDGSFGLTRLEIQFFGSWRRWSRVFGGLPHFVVECEVYLVIG